MHGKFNRDAAGFTDTFTQAVCQLQVVAVAGGKVGARLRDTDDRAIGLQFGLAETEVHVALEIKRRHVRIRGIVKPRARTQLALSCRKIIRCRHDAGLQPEVANGKILRNATSLCCAQGKWNQRFGDHA